MVLAGPKLTRLNTVFLALGVVVAVATPLAVRAQSGDAIAHGEQICLDNGVGPSTVAFDTCTARAAQAYSNGEPEAAAAEARRLSDARELCMSNDIDPMTAAYRQCLASETQPRTYALSYVPDAYR